MAKQQLVKIKLRQDLKGFQRRAVGLEIIDHIKARTLQGKGKDGKPWSAKAARQYSKQYKESFNFKLKKGRGRVVDLDLSSEMLNSMKIISHRKGEIVIGYDGRKRRLNGKVEGNRLGTYGQSTPRWGKKRDFLGIERKKLVELQDKYDIDDMDVIRERAERIERAFDKGGS